MKIPEGYLYTQEHEWAKVEDGEALFGLTAYATDQLGGITFIDLPENGSPVTQAEPFAEVESVKAVSDIYAPASGKITEVHEQLSEQPELIDADPYRNGWICRVKLSDASELEDLMDPGDYEDYVAELDD